LSEILLRAPATIANFGPGFDIFAIALAEPHDELRIAINDRDRISICIEGMDEGLPRRVEDNAAGIAAAQFLRRTGLSTGVEIEIRKGMKSCSGLGTSGASAAATVFGLDQLLETDLSPVEIVDIARQGETATGSAAHADNVAGCLLGGFVFISSYAPLRVERLDLPDVPAVIAVMKKPRQTTREFIPKALDLRRVTDQMARCAALVKAVMNGDLEEIGQAINTDHISEPVRGRFIPGYDEVKKRALEEGAFGCSVSGGGSSVFAICTEEKREAVAEIFELGFRRYGLEPEILITRAGNEGVREIDET